MRTALASLDLRSGRFHAGLAYERTGVLKREHPRADDNERRDNWLDDIARVRIDPDYVNFFEARWESGLRSSPRTRTVDIELIARLLVGHGNPSASEVGITLHHTWGVPIIPGSALKGLLAHHAVAHYDGIDPENEPWRGVVFHDALYIPGSCEHDSPFSRDVLTVHQKSYYNGEGKSWPNDHDEPNPVAFLTVRPGARFLLALEGPPDLLDLAETLVLDALDDWGIGGKTTLGYGRLRKAGPRRPPASPPPTPPAASGARIAEAKPGRQSPTLAAFMKWMNETRPVAETFESVLTRWSAQLLELDDDERRLAANQLERRKCKRVDLTTRITALVARLRGAHE